MKKILLLVGVMMVFNSIAQITWMGNEYTTIGTQYLGDDILFEIQSYPTAQNQGAQIYIDWGNDGYGSTSGVDYFALNWIANVGNNSKWNNYVRMREVGNHNRKYLGWQTGHSDYVTGNFGTFTVNALENPSSPSATSVSISQINLSWSKWNSKNVMIVRQESNDSWTAPTQGTSYSVTDVIGDGVVVYNGSDENLDNTSLSASTTYYYKLYSVNNDYYSPGSVVSATTGAVISSSTGGAWGAGTTWGGGSVPTSIDNVTINNAVTIGVTTEASVNNLTISDAKAGSLTIQSTSSGTGSLIVDGTLTNNGTISVERYVETSTEDLFYKTIASPVAGAAVFNDADQFAYYTEGSNEWVTYWNDAGHTTVNPNFETTFKLGRGYTLYYAAATTKTISATGAATLNNSDITLNSGSDPALTYAGTSAYKGTNLVGNPFASAIDWDASSGWTRTNIGNSIYIWNGTAEAYGVYTLGNSGSGTNGVTNIIPVMQGFWVNATAASPELTIGKATRVHSSQALMKQSPVNTLRLKVSGENWSDECLMVLRDDATNGIDAWDAMKWISPSENVPNLYFIVNEEKLAGNSMLNLNDIEYLQLGLTKGIEENYTISTEFLESFEDTDFYLEDTKTGEITLLGEGIAYSFALASDDSPLRFKLWINGITGVKDQITTPKAFAYTNGNNLHIRNMEGDYTMRMNDISGRNIMQQQIKGNAEIALPSGLNAGVYLLEITSGSNRTVQKVVIN
jgi:hypothetical protein